MLHLSGFAMHVRFMFSYTKVDHETNSTSIIKYAYKVHHLHLIVTYRYLSVHTKIYCIAFCTLFLVLIPESNHQQEKRSTTNNTKKRDAVMLGTWVNKKVIIYYYCVLLVNWLQMKGEEKREKAYNLIL